MPTAEPLRHPYRVGCPGFLKNMPALLGASWPRLAAQRGEGFFHVFRRTSTSSCDGDQDVGEFPVGRGPLAAAFAGLVGDPVHVDLAVGGLLGHGIVNDER